jgi:glycosyltransferase involved in cell wall biosynthesis
MKILLTMNLPYTRWSGGANRANRHLLEALAARGHDPTAIVPLLGAPSRESEEDAIIRLTSEATAIDHDRAVLRYSLDGVRVHAVRERKNLRAYLDDYLHSSPPDITIVSSEDQSQLLLDTVSRYGKIPVVYLAHTPQMLPFGPESLHPGNARTQLVMRSHAIASISATVAQYIHAHLGRESYVMRFPCFGNPPFPRCDSFAAKTVLFLNPCAVKGIAIFLALARAFPNCNFVAVPGYGTTDRDLRELRSLSNVSIRNNMRDLNDLMRDTSVLVTPTLWMEGFGLVVVDAMLRGIPVLASAHGGLLEAKLGTPGLIPAIPITSYLDTLDEALLPDAVVPMQNPTPWCEALSTLLFNESEYRHQSALSIEAAEAFVGSLNINPTESWLESLVRGQNSLALPKSRSQKNPLSLEGRIRSLTPVKQAVLLHRLAESVQGRRVPVLVRSDSVSDGIPLSHAQEGIWLAQQITPTSSSYNMPLLLGVSGPLSLDALRGAVRRLLHRHAILRTQFRLVDGIPCQFVQPEQGLGIDVVDIATTDITLERAISDLERLSATPFRLDRDLPIRIIAGRLSASEWLLLIVVHHICCDGWSVAILADELHEAYRLEVEAIEDTRPPLSVQYADYAMCQRKRACSPAILRELDYWRSRLRVFVPLRLVTSTVVTEAGGLKAGVHHLDLASDTNDTILRVSRNYDLSPFTVVLAAVAILMHFWSGQSNIPIAVDVANRNDPLFDNLIGLIANQLLLLLEINPSLAVPAVLSCAASTLRDALNHQEASWEQVVDLLPGRHRGTGLSPYQVKLVYADKPVAITLPGLDVREISRPRSMTKCDLTFFVEQDAGRFSIDLEYDADRIERSTIVKYGQHLSTIFRFLATDSACVADAAPIPLAFPEVSNHSLVSADGLSRCTNPTASRCDHGQCGNCIR